MWDNKKRNQIKHPQSIRYGRSMLYIIVDLSSKLWTSSKQRVLDSLDLQAHTV